jgi:twitching motility protein PilT
MPALDKLLDLTDQVGASALLLRPGDMPTFQTPTGLRPAAGNILDQARVLWLVKELASSEDRGMLDQHVPVSFAYRGFTVEAVYDGMGTTARIVPHPASQPAGISPAPQPARPTGAPIDTLFRMLVQTGGSDLHLSTDEPPRIRLNGDMVALDHPRINTEQMGRLLWPICPPASRDEWDQGHDTDFAYEIKGLARFRCNYLMDRHGLRAVFRQIPTRIPTTDELGLPAQTLDLCWLSRGFVVVTGPTGSGKSTTLAALVAFVNENRAEHIITIEDPIEFVHASKKCLLTQREVGSHTEGFRRALRAALREDPDIVLIGDMRDLETVAIAIETAETGHLVFGTLHTTTAQSTIDRIIDQFPPDRQAQVRVMLSESLRGIVAQTLCKKRGGGRVAAFEILMVNTAISDLIREGKTFQIPSVMQRQKSQGSMLLNDSLLDLVKRELVEPREAYIKSVDKAGLRALFERHKIPLEMSREA